MIKKKQMNNIYIKLVYLLVLIQPFLDIYKSIAEKKLEIFGISIIEIINFVLILLIVIFTIFFNKNRIKLKSLIIISLIYLIYFIFHLYNLKQFNTELYANNNINIYREFYFIVKSYIQPIMFIYCIYLNKMDKKHFYNILKYLIFIVCSIIVFTNLLNISLISYSIDNKSISYNIFKWFTYDGTYFKSLTSKGLFFSANQLSNLLFFLLPINYYICYNQRKLFNYFTLILQIVSMYMIGTKVATLGCVLLLFICTLMIIVFSIIYKKSFKKTIPIMICILICLPIFNYCPFILEIKNPNYLSSDDGTNNNDDLIYLDKTSTISFNSKYTQKNVFKNIKPMIYINKNINLLLYEKPHKILFTNSCNNITGENKQSIIAYMENNFYYYNIKKEYIESYPIKDDFVFYCRRFKQLNFSNHSSRKFKTSIFNRITELNNNKLDKFFGLGYTLNMLDLERDYYNQYYQFGILGLFLLISPYFILLILCVLKLLKNFRKKFKLQNFILILSIFCGLGSPLFAGHFYSNLFIVFPFSLIIINSYTIIRGDNDE